MTLTLEQFREHVVDYLYGELEGDELRAFEAALADSEAYRRELQELRSTLGLARRALRGAAAEEPPARVRAAVLAAAQVEARARSAKRDERSEAPAWFEWAGLRALLRTPWLFPALGAAAALLFVVLRERVEETASNELAPPAASALEPAANPGPDTPASGADKLGSEGSSGGAGAVAHERAEPRAGAGVARPRRAPSQGPFGAGAGERSARDLEPAPPPYDSEQRRRKLERSASAPERSWAEAPPQARSASAQPSAKGRAVDDFAAPAPGKPERVERDNRAAARAPDSQPTAEVAASPATSSGAKPELAEREELAAARATDRGPAGEPAASPPGGAGPRTFATPPPEPARAAASAPADSTAPTARAANADAPGEVSGSIRAAPAARPAAPAPSAKGTANVRAAAELTRRAREHVAAGHWRQAAEAYRELLRRHPADPAAPEWRRQLAQALSALASDAAR